MSPAEIAASLTAAGDEFQQSEAWQRELRRVARAARPRIGATAQSFVARPLSGAAKVPILMYHHVAEAGPGADAIRRDLSVTPANFAAQLDYLERAGFSVISLAALTDHLATSRPLPPRAVVLTFDDGYLDNFTAAFPLLRSHGFVGTFFLITDFLGFGEYMSWEQARQLSVSGMEVGSHTLDHPDLTQLSPERQARQLAESRKILESRLDTLVTSFCYPAGRFSAAVAAAAGRAGYATAVTTVYGTAHSAGRPLELSRVRISGKDSLEVFAAKLGGPAPSSLAPASPGR